LPASSAGSRFAPSPQPKGSASAGCRIVRQRPERSNVNPADDYAFLQIARLERALDLIGGQIDAGKPAAAHAFVRILDLLNRLAPDRLRLREATFRFEADVDTMAERLGRLDAARETLVLRNAELRPQTRDDSAKSNRAQIPDNKGNRETPDFAPSIISKA
jgi:hypothetical protein